MNSDEIIENLLKKQNVKQDINVVELYLGKNQLRTMNNLGRFRMLQRVWLNSNKLRHLLTQQTHQSFLKDNFRITELYLQGNEICEIEGTLSHLRYLQVLMLQKNQLASLPEALQELIPLQALRVLNLFDNPLAQEPGYRLLVIHTLPSVELLDRQEVTASERKLAREVHRADREAIRASVAFGRRADINPALLHTLQKPIKTYLPVSPQNHLENIRKKGKLIRQNLEHRRSVMQYTTLDWSRVPDSEQRRLGQVVPPPQNLTVKFR